MKYWLMKSEPDVYGIDNLQKDKFTIWEGVRNYQARNFMRDNMSINDEVLFYHSSCDIPGIYGLAEVSKVRVVDKTQFEKKSEYFDKRSKVESPSWICVEVKFIKKFLYPITLSEIREDENLQNMRVVQKGSRLSIQPVDKKDFEYILKLSEQRK